MNEAIKIIITKVVIIMNPINIDHDVMLRSKITEVTFDLGIKSTCTIENLGVNTHAVLTTWSRIHFGLRA